MTETKTAVYLNDADSARFVLFLKHYPIVAQILDVVEVQRGVGAITIHFDQNGRPKTIERVSKQNIV